MVLNSVNKTLGCTFCQVDRSNANTLRLHSTRIIISDIHSTKMQIGFEKVVSYLRKTISCKEKKEAHC